MIVDLIILSFVILMVVSGWKQGLLLTIARLAATLLSLLAAWFLVIPLTRVLEEAPFLSPLARQMDNRLIVPMREAGNSLFEAILEMNLPRPLDIFFTGRFASQDNSLLQWTELSAAFFRLVLTGGLILLLFSLLILILFRIIRSTSQMVNALPLAGTINRLGGIAASLLLSLLALHITLLVIILVIPLFPELGRLIEQSMILRWFLEARLWHNLLDTIFS